MKRYLLEEVIKESGFKKSYLAEQLNISKRTLSYKLNGTYDWKLSEVIALSGILNLSHEKSIEIFFDKEVEWKET